jgi:hypothetical protein
MTFSTLCDDSQAILDYASSLGFTDFALLGTRIGALVAAATAKTRQATPLALWEPSVDPMRSIIEANRAKLISRAARGGVERLPGWQEELEINGVLDLLGYDVYPALLESLQGLDLLTILGLEPRQIFIADFKGGTTPSSLVQELLKRDFSVESGTFDLSESWWFQNELVGRSDELIEATTAWLRGVLPEKSNR